MIDLLLKHTYIELSQIAWRFRQDTLRAHSDLLPNPKVNDWALSFSENFDIQVEAKGKNMASEQLYRQAKENSVI